VIALVDGELAEKGPDRVVVAAGGVGYEVMVPAATLAKLPPVGKRAKLFTRMQVRDDSMLLFGFATSDERDLFDMLVKVNGVGPKFALNILSALTPDDLRRAVAAGDADALTVVPGIGKKVAGRLVLDLRDKLGVDADVPSSGPLAEVRDGLLSLGLSTQEARDAIASLDGSSSNNASVEELLREALKSVGRA
jgi:Holliday junction DNA helicase RuvA